VQNISKNKIKWIRSLHSKKNRDSEQLFLVEGDKMIAESLVYKKENIHSIYYTNLSQLDLKTFSEFENFEITEKELEQISTLKNPSKSFAVLKYDVVKPTKSTFKIAVDTVQDPGNMGTILRLADWFGVDEVICSFDTVDIYNPKVVQASMGAIFRVNVTYCDLPAYIKESELPSYGAFLEGTNIYSSKLSPKGILVLGNEGNGISDAVKKEIDHYITIPKKGKSESLNVSTATGILLSEFFRNELL